jgi:hypothetical protein
MTGYQRFPEGGAFCRLKDPKDDWALPGGYCYGDPSRSQTTAGSGRQAEGQTSVYPTAGSKLLINGWQAVNLQ